MRSLIFTFLAITLSLTGLHAQVFSDSNWHAMGDALQGINGRIEALAEDGSGNLYVAGDFSVVGNQSISGLAKWDGNSWSSVGFGLNGQPQVLSFVGNDLYVAGNISINVSNQPSINSIARWDGNSWSGVGGGVQNGGVSSLLVSGSDIYVGGDFDTAGDQNSSIPAAGIAKWDGNSWSALGSGVSGGNRPTVNAIVSIGNDIYAGGEFTTAGGVTVNNVAKWDGSNWSELDAVNPGVTSGFGANVQALLVDGSELIVGGSFDTAGGNSADYLARWNGSSWSPVGGGLGGQVNDLAFSNTGDLIATGNFYSPHTDGSGTVLNGVGRWDGNAWSALGTGLSGGHAQGTAILVSGSNLIVGGSFQNAGGAVGTTNLAMWNGSAWSSVGGLGSITATALDGSVNAIATSGNSDAYVGGQFTTAAGTTVNHVAKWDGSSWSALGTGVTFTFGGANVEALAVDGNGDLYVGGDFDTAGGSPSSRNIAKWDGSSWSALGSGVTNGGSVRSIALSGSDVYMTGYFNEVDGTPAGGIARWDGTNWSTVGSGVGLSGNNNGGDAIAISPITGDLYVAGSFTSVDGVAANRIAKWDGNSWSAVGAGIDDGEVYALSFDSNGNLWVGGRFQFVNGNKANNVAKWDGNSWSVISRTVNNQTETGTQGDVLSLQATGKDLYLGGWFHVQVPNQQGFGNLAKWDGSSLTSLGSGVNNQVRAMDIIGTDPVAARTLYVGGGFGTAGGQGSLFAANASLPAAIPEIAVSQPAGSDIINGGSRNAGSAVVGGSTDTTFTIDNVGFADLTGLGITLTGSSDFTVTAPPSAPLSSGGTTSFTITFAPSSIGAKSATVEIASNDGDENPFTIQLSGTGVELPPVSLVVDNAGDTDDGNFGDGEQTLREAIARANISSDANTITFDFLLDGTTILLGSPLDTIAHPVTITGNGATQTVIDAQQNGRVLTIDDGNSGNEIAVTLEGLTLQGGLSPAVENGGGILSNENLTIRTCEIASNATQGFNEGAPFGGGVFSGGTILVEDSTISGNSNTGITGGIMVTGAATLRNTTISGNSALANGGFGVAAFGGSPSASLVNCSVIGNTGSFAPFGPPFGGILAFGAPLGLENCIVAGNVEVGDASDINLAGEAPAISPALNNMIGDPASAGGLVHGTDGNILGDGSGSLLALSSIVGALANNGGETSTHLPASGSPAINAGNNASAAALSTDQRGDTRIQGTIVDIGSVETDTPAPANSPPTYTSYSLVATENISVSVNNAKLLSKASDTDGDPLSITDVSATSTAGGTVSLGNGSVTYSPPADTTGADTFTITVSDGTDTVVGTVNVTINAAPTGQSGNNLSVTVQQGSGDVDLVYLGIPGRTYNIQRSTDLENWTIIATITAAGNGTITHTDTEPPQQAQSVFYRTSAQ